MKRVVLLFLILFIVIGCGPLPMTPRKASYNDADYESYRKTGTAKITGQAFLMTRGGVVRYGAGRPVYLNPATLYADEDLRIRRKSNSDLYMDALTSGHRNEPSDTRFLKLEKQTVADAQGNFEFSDLPAGEYFIDTTITWETGGRSGSTTGGNIRIKVTIKDGETKKVVLTE